MHTDATCYILIQPQVITQQSWIKQHFQVHRIWQKHTAVTPASAGASYLNIYIQEHKAEYPELVSSLILLSTNTYYS